MASQKKVFFSFRSAGSPGPGVKLALRDVDDHLLSIHKDEFSSPLSRPPPGLPVTMTPLLLFFLSTPLLPQRSRHSVPFCARRPSPRLSAGPPPKVKSSYYKNPSKAIEKGGGFYIPGLRGPRLRIAVSTLSCALLSLNHLTAGAEAAQKSLQASETIAATAAFAVLATALADIAEERREAAPAAKAPVDPIGETVARQETPETATAAPGDVAEDVLWSTAVSADLTGATAFAVCRDGQVVHASGLAVGDVASGEAVSRVTQERRAVYIDDTGTLPPDVTLPFLPESEWAVFLVPQEGGVVTFAKKKGGGFDKRQRDWLTQMAIRMARGCRE